MKRIVVDKGECIACGFCVGACPEVFEFGDDMLSQTKIDFTDEVSEAVKVAVEGCPTNAIKIEDIGDEIKVTIEDAE